MPDMTPETTITATEFAKNLSAILSRVQNHGEHFTITRRGARVASLGPTSTPPITWGAFGSRYRDIPPADDQFADDLDEIIASRARINPLPGRD
jgi:antitoxin (DNA-binding transcriptional repressor) of toxin-antitoxin stability system